MAKGNIIFLNGTSSSGKTIIAKTLQQILDETYLHCSVDSFFEMLLPEKYISPDGTVEISKEDFETLQALIPKVISGMHHCIPALASEGINLIVDQVLQSPAWLNDCVDLLADFPVLFVGAQCPLEGLERREQERDREPGLARRQFDVVHAHKVYDVEVDTFTHSPMECAVQIEEALHNSHPPMAFARLRDRPVIGPASQS